MHLGCQGWTYPDWIGVFYPPGARQETLLPFYAGIFDTVELDNTFYRAPQPTLVRSWARHTPAGFRFAAKAPREITHDTPLGGAGPALLSFLRALEGLGEKLGPILLQFPASFRRTEESFQTLHGFLGAVPSGFRLAVEFRSPSWQDPSVLSLLEQQEACLAWTDWRDLPAFRRRTTDFLYLRWLGNRSDIERYDRVQIDRGSAFDDWQETLEAVRGEVTDVFGYFNNHWAGHSPASVRELLRRLGEPARDPRDDWPQGELF